MITLKQFVVSLIPLSKQGDEEIFRKHRLIININIVTAFYALSYVPVCLLIKYYSALPCIVFIECIIVLSFSLMKKEAGISIITNIYLTSISLCEIWLMLRSGGIVGNPTDPLFVVVLPIIALLCIGKKAALFWFIIGILIIFSVGMGQVLGYHYPIDIPSKYIALFGVLSYCGHLVFIFIFISIFDSGKVRVMNEVIKQRKIADAEKQKSENLLLNILPAEISAELKQTGKTKARSYSTVSVMFGDFVNFTRIGELLTPERLVFTIGEYFEAFDHVIEKYGIEKIKTVGDAYICAAGLPVPTEDNAITIIQVAIDILKATEELSIRRRAQEEETFGIRIGIHSGPLVAGVVGVKKFAYDIWGDTVNMAARMQESSDPGRINISETTFNLIKHRFICTKRGRIEAKHKGLVDMYFVDMEK